MKIAFAYNLKPKNIRREDPEAEFYAEFDTDETIDGIKKAIEANGHEVLMAEANENTYELLKENRNNIDLLFNFAEAVTNTADREAQIPMFCEILKIPYTGPKPMNAALILDKARTKEIWNFWKVATAPFQLMETADGKLNPELKFPLIAKANEEGSSSGIRNKSVVNNEKDLREIVAELIKDFQQPILVEKFLSGREFTVGVLGNKGNLQVLPIVETNFDSLPKGVNRIDSYEAKWIWDNPDNPIEAIFCPAKVEEKLKTEIEDLAKRAFTAIGCRDWGRIDMRQDENGKLYALEINCPVGLLPDPKENSRLPRAAKEMGWSFEKLVGEIILTAAKRYQLSK